MAIWRLLYGVFNYSLITPAREDRDFGLLYSAFEPAFDSPVSDFNSGYPFG